MSDYPALLRAILLDPRDDTARLVIADWFQENDQEPRAEFVRIQHDLSQYSQECNWLSNMPAVSWAGDPHERDVLSELERLRCRERGLLARHGNAWVPKSLRHAEYDWLCTTYRRLVRWDGTNPIDARSLSSEATFARGFISHISLTCKQFLTPNFAATLFNAQPITSVTLTDKYPQMWIHEIVNLMAGCAGRWFWCVDVTTPRYAHILPAPLRHSSEWLDAKWYCNTPTYETMSLAHAALSRACVAYGREQAALPPLPT